MAKSSINEKAARGSSGNVSLSVPRSRRTSAFTLVELMIVVAIIGILAAVAYPAYTEQVRKARRADARAALVDLSQYMERFFTENDAFDKDRAGNAIVLPFTKSPRDGGNTFYNLSLAAVAPASYSLQAVPAGDQAKDRCGTLTLNHTGAKTPNSPSDCWER